MKQRYNVHFKSTSVRSCTRPFHFFTFFVIFRGAVKVWQPKVTPLSQLRSGDGHGPANLDGPDPYVQKTSLAADKQEFKAIGSGHNRTARPFCGFGTGAPSAPPPTAGFAPTPVVASHAPPAPAPAPVAVPTAPVSQFMAGEAAAFAPVRPAAHAQVNPGKDERYG